MSKNRIRVWDLPTRIFHWALVIVVVAAFVTGLNGGTAMVHHGRLGIILIGLLAFRLAWGVLGSTTARFSHFVRGPGAILAYLRGQWHGIGHNPLGALSVLALMGVFGAQAILGLFSFDDIAFGGPLRRAVSSDTSAWLTSIHRDLFWVMIALVALHVSAILFYALGKKENLVRPMLTGWKETENQKLESTRGGGWRAFVIAVAIGLLAAWIASGALLPPPPPAPDPATLPSW